MHLLQSTTIGAKTLKSVFQRELFAVLKMFFAQKKIFFIFFFSPLGRHCFLLNKKVLVWQLQAVNASHFSQTCYLTVLDNNFVRLGWHTATPPVGGMLSLLWRVWQLQNGVATPGSECLSNLTNRLSNLIR